jgi:glycosyltransferase involved in cell wall biosynthesis
MLNLIKAFYYNFLVAMQSRNAKLTAQYYRSLALPNHGYRISKSLHNDSNSIIDISVVITYFNYYEYIMEAIQSVFASNVGDLSIELIVVDDASKDKCFEFLKKILCSAPIPMRIIRNYWNVGVSKSRNIGINCAKGEFIFILDADNVIFPKALHNLHFAIIQNNAAAAYGPIHRQDLTGHSQGVVSNRPFDPDFLKHVGNYIDAMALFRRSTLLELGGYNLSLMPLIGGWEDYALWLELAHQNCKVEFSPETVGIYRVKCDSMVSQITRDEIKSFSQFASRRYADYTAFEEKI